MEPTNAHGHEMVESLSLLMNGQHTFPAQNTMIVCPNQSYYTIVINFCNREVRLRKNLK